MDEEYEISPEDINEFDPIDVFLFQEEITDSFRRIMTKIPKIVEKAFVVDESCLKKLSFFITPSDLKDFNFESVTRILEKKDLDCEPKVIVYLITPTISALECIEYHMQTYDEKRKEDPQKYYERDYHVIFIPRITNKCFTYIQKSIYNTYYNKYNLTIDCFPLDYDLISLEEHESFKDIYINNNYDCLVTFARIIAKFEDLFGKIKYKYIKGDFSKILNELLMKNESEMEVENSNEILAAVFIDRTVDLTTPFVTHATYEGLLDEYFGINQNMIKVSTKMLDKLSNQDYTNVILNKTDRFYSMIKEYTFKKIRLFLSSRIKQHDIIIHKGKTLTDMKDIQLNLIKVKAVQLERTSLANHVCLADYIAKQQLSTYYKLNLRVEHRLLNGDFSNNFHDIYESSFARKADIVSVLKLICLESITQGGFKPKELDKIKRDIIHSYGYQEIFLLNNLEKFKILKKHDNFNLFNFLIDKFKLISHNVDYINPNDPAFAYGGYIPLTVRLIQKVVDGGWGGILDILNKLPGVAEFPKEENDIIFPFKEDNIILLCFVGGITYGEIAAIRFLSKILPRHKFMIITTSIINSKTFINQLRYTTPSDKILNNDQFYHTFVANNALPPFKK